MEHRKRHQRHGNCRIVFASISTLQQPVPDAEKELAQNARHVLSSLQLEPVLSLHKSQDASTWLKLPWTMHNPHRDATSVLPRSTNATVSSKRRFPLPKSTQQLEQSPDCDDPPGKPRKSKNALRTRRSNEKPDDSTGVVCVEATAGRQRVYRVQRGEEAGSAWEGFDMVEDPQTHHGRLKALISSYLLPQGFPDSVAPQYATYMSWRGVQYFFGGAMSVFTTQSLLGALGVAGRHKVMP